MSVANELTLVSILTLLAEKYPDGVKGEKIVEALGTKGKEDLRKCVYYSIDKGYVVKDEVPGEWAAGVTVKEVADALIGAGQYFRIEGYIYKLTVKGVRYLDGYNRRIARVLEEIKRGELGFKV